MSHFQLTPARAGGSFFDILAIAMDNFFDLKTILTISHLVGVVFGAGGAAASDLMFFSCIKDHRISKTEARFLRLGSAMTWGGLAILILSGIGLFLTDPTHYMASAKFISKMLIVAIITVNGALFHFDHIPWLHKHIDIPLRTAEQFTRRAPRLIISGAVSVTGWMAALVLGSLRAVPLTVSQVMIGYGVILLIAITIGLSMQNRIFCIPSCTCKVKKSRRR